MTIASIDWVHENNRPPCRICGKPITIMINRNEAVCSENCRKRLPQEPQQ